MIKTGRRQNNDIYRKTFRRTHFATACLLDGSAQVYNYRTIRMNCGIDHFTGEMTGELAVKWPYQQQLDSVALWVADVTLHTKEFQTMNGELRTVTVVRVTRLEPLA